jgi:Bacterial Ig-like domain (group 3)/FG-GAP-like repeat/FG-GAP repeat
VLNSSRTLTSAVGLPKLMLSAKALLRILSGVRSLLVLLIALLVSASISAQTQPIFPTTSFYPGSNFYATAAGDFNGDGQPDLAYISYKQLGATVLLNQGATTPPIAVVTNPLNCGAITIAAADMNADKRLDLVLTCSEGYVVVLLGNGDGTFQTPAYYSVPGLSSPALPVDLNGDGYPDIAATGIQQGTTPAIAILLNQGSNSPGTLAIPKFYTSTNSSNYSLAAGDFNGDGKQDILAGSSSLAVFYGNGDGTLQAPQTLPSPAGGSFVAADLNQDGITDVAYVASTGSAFTIQSVQVLLGSSSGQFTNGINLLLNLSSVPYSLVAAGSTNGGKNANLALVGDNISILKGDGKGGFALGQSFALSGSVTPEVRSDGTADLAVSTALGLTLLSGNGDGTFQGLTTQPVSGASTAEDVNGDGLTDVLYLDPSGSLTTALGRGNGTFSVISYPAKGTPSNILVTGDFNADGKLDTAAILTGHGIGHGATTQQDSELFLFIGNGDGTFQSAKAGVDLQVVGAAGAIVGDFNGDGFLDVVAQYLNYYAGPPLAGLVFLPGKGDGTFGTPVPFSQSTTLAAGQILSADLNNDKRPDLICNNVVYLANGDGTFEQIPLGLTGTALAIGDLNGDGIADLVIGSGVYAGNGDGTFQSAPFYTATLPQFSSTISGVIGDVNADGHADLVLQYVTSANTSAAAPFFGDGKGNFVTDGNTYYTGSTVDYSNDVPGPISLLARLNNRAPTSPNDNALDYLTFTNGGATSLLNLTNPTPAAPAQLPSTTSLAVSATNANLNQQLNLTATVTGVNPAGSVSFVSGTTTLGTAAVSNGTAILPYSFTAAGTYTVVANYAGDSANLASTSTSVSVVVVAPDFTISASPSSATITAGQSASTTLTVTPIGGYSGTLHFSCGTLPTGVTCTFTPASLTPANGAAATVGLTVSTTASRVAEQRSLDRGLSVIAWAGAIFLAFSPKRIRRMNRLITHSFLLLILMSALVSLSGCSSSSPSHQTTPGAPTGAQAIAVTAADSSGNLSHPINFQVTVQ